MGKALPVLTVAMVALAVTASVPSRKSESAQTDALELFISMCRKFEELVADRTSLEEWHAWLPVFDAADLQIRRMSGASYPRLSDLVIRAIYCLNGNYDATSS